MRTQLRLMAVGLVLVCLGWALPVEASRSTYAPRTSQTLRSIPDTHPLAYLSARDHLSLGETDAALQRTRRAVEQFPYHRRSFALHFRLLTEEHSTGQAVKWAREHLKSTGDSGLLNALLENQRVNGEGVRPLLRWGLEYGFYTANVVVHLVKNALEKKDHRRATELLERTRGQYPDDVRLQYYRAGLQAIRGNCDAALRTTNQLLKAHPERPGLYRLKAQLLRNRNPEGAQFQRERYRQLQSENHASSALVPLEVSCE